MMYGAEPWALKKEPDNKLEFAEMRMLRMGVQSYEAGQDQK